MMQISQHDSLWARKTIFAIAGALFVLSFANIAFALPVSGDKGIVASAHSDATQAGVTMLRQGGNAIDAAVATAFALGVVEPYSSGIGGGGFALVRFNDELFFFDFREKAPKATHEKFYFRNGEPKQELAKNGPLSVGIPGAVAGYLELHKKYGKLSRQQVMQPAIDSARQGVTVDERFQRYLTWRKDLLAQDPVARSIFLVKDANGRNLADTNTNSATSTGNDTSASYLVPPIGYRIVQEDLANTLEAIAKKGADEFYLGATAKKLIADIKKRGGVLTASDLSGYKTTTREPLVGTFRGHALATSPLPSAGGQVVLTVLNMLEQLPKDLPWHHPEVLHTYIEASKRAFADRFLLGDPDFVTDITPNLIAKDRAEVLMQVIGPKATPISEISPGQGAQLPPKFLEKHQSARPAPEGDDTTHLSVIDAKGNAVSMTTTVNYGFGAGIVAEGVGLVWNNEMDDFSVAEGVENAYSLVGSEPNLVRPGKIPLSSMSPTLVFQGDKTSSPIELVIGSPGGPRIPTSVLQAIYNYYTFDMNIQDAINAGRIHNQYLPDKVYVEHHTLDALTVKALQERGHTLEIRRTWSNIAAIAVDPETGVRFGAADRRGVGSAAAQ